MTTTEKIEKGKQKALALVLEAFEEMDKNRLDLYGGYPAVIDEETLPEYIIIANVTEDGAPNLIIWEKNQVMNVVLEGTPYSEDWTVFDVLCEAGFCL